MFEQCFQSLTNILPRDQPDNMTHARLAQVGSLCFSILTNKNQDVVQRKGGREEIIFSVNTPGSIKYCGAGSERERERMNSRAALKTSALYRRAIIIKYYSVKKKFQPRGFLNRNLSVYLSSNVGNESSLFLHSCFLNVIFVCKLNNILIFVCKVRKQCKSQ